MSALNLHTLVADPVPSRWINSVDRRPTVVTGGDGPYNHELMSASASLPEVRRTKSPVVKTLSFLAGLLLLAILAAVAWLYITARSPLPQLEGRVAVPGISAKVRVIRDGHGVPTIEAATPEDLFFAQGYVTAQDRLWQMDALRRAAAGELAEILGEDLVKMDREQRILGLRAAAQNAEKLMSPRDRR